ncbi:MAG: hypothetical protein IJ013_07810 [Bacteroidaceae bacterium]|nr:hypothetical protein [Bacteroidaceae bacterium]
MNEFLFFLLFYVLWEVAFSFPSTINAIHEKFGIDWWARTEFRPLSFTFIYYCIPFIVGYMTRKGGNTDSSSINGLYEFFPNIAIAISFAIWMFLSERIANWFLEYRLAKKKLKNSRNWEAVEVLADNGDVSAQKELGIYHMQIHYINMKNIFNLEDRNNSEYNEAIAWLEKAAIHGDKEAKRIVSMKDQLYDEITLDESFEDTMNRLSGKGYVDVANNFAVRLKSGLYPYICIRCVSLLLYFAILLLFSIILEVNFFN